MFTARRMFCRLVLIVFFGAAPTTLAQQAVPQPWQTEFLAGLEQLHQGGTVAHFPEFGDYADLLLLRSPRELLQIVERRVSLKPYRGSMIDPAAALLGGVANSLDRARLLSDLLTITGRESRIRGTDLKLGWSQYIYPHYSPVALDPITPRMNRAMAREVQRLAPPIWQRICPDPESCQDWSRLIDQTSSPGAVYWVQYTESGKWHDLVPGDTRLSEKAKANSRVISGGSLEALRWKVAIRLLNQYEGYASTEAVLEFEAPVAQLNYRPISIDNIADFDNSGFVPTLSVAGYSPLRGSSFELRSEGQALSHQLLEVAIHGPR